MSGGDGDRDAFFHCLDRVPSSLHLDADFPSDEDDDDDEDVRVSFASAAGDQNQHSFRRYQAAVLEEEEEEEVQEDPSQYDMWMSDDMSIKERRRRLHQGLGMASSRDLALRRHSMKKRPADVVPRSVSRRLQPPPLPSPTPRPTVASAPEAPPKSTAAAAKTTPAPAAAALQPARAITRRHSDSSLAVRDGGGASGSKKPHPQPLRRVRSLPARHAAARDGSAPVEKAARELPVAPLPAASSSSAGGNGEGGDGKKNGADDVSKNSGGKDVAVAAASKQDDASSSSNTAAQSGVLGLEAEFEKFIGNTPIVKHLVRRGTSQHHQHPQPPPAGGAPPKAEKPAGKKKGGGWLNNIKSVAIGFIHDKDTNNAKSSAASNAAAGAPGASSSSSERLKVHQYGKSSKELTGLYMCQEIQAHEGSIWSVKFSADGRRLASAGEDHVVRVWRVVETSAPPGFLAQDGSPAGAAADGGGAASTPGLAQLSKKSVKGKPSGGLPEHLVVPDKVFALAEQPACVLEGHNDDVLDLTWSKSDQLLSSSMDKTVRLWDTERQVCLKTFTHSDYVTCIHFNPVDDRYFISGSLDAKVRLWSIPNRQVVDWTDLNEMVTAASYTPDGQGAIVGSHKGSCRLYKITDCKLNQEAQIDIQNKKRSSKSQEKKITGFQFASANPSEVLVTSADSQIRVFDGVTMVQKFRGYKNTSSQISASYTTDGRYAVCASEDSHVYLWRTARVAPASAGMGIGMKPKTWCTIRSYENFYCKDVSAAVPWPHSPAPPGGESPSSQAGGVSCNEESCSMASHAAKPADGGGRSGELGTPPLTHSGELSRPHGGGGGGKSGGDGGNAWGVVMVAASLGGEIRVYQNFGLPFRIRGQGNLFG